jgi:hypothetical protein
MKKILTWLAVLAVSAIFCERALACAIKGSCTSSGTQCSNSGTACEGAPEGGCYCEGSESGYGSCGCQMTVG